MSFNFEWNHPNLIVRYEPEEWTIEEFLSELKNKKTINLHNIFYLTEGDIIPNNFIDKHNDYINFILGEFDGDGYYRINKNILDIDNDLFIFSDLDLTIKHFKAYRNISIFKKIDKLVQEPIFIGGHRETAIPLSVFDQLIKKFPTSWETKKYADARIEHILSDYLETMSPAQEKLNQYLERKEELKIQLDFGILYKFEIEKFQYIYEELCYMLKNSDNYSEKVWQDRILPILLLIFPKYVAVLSEVIVPDEYSSESDNKKIKRRIDLMLVSADGTVDIIELKKPFEYCLLSKNEYRDNYRVHRELSGAIMQSEKYLFYLNKGGKKIEQEIQEQHRCKLPDTLKIKIINPKAIILMGRSHNLEVKQKWDFEIIRRQYANIADIMTYDDLLERVRNIISKFQSSTHNTP